MTIALITAPAMEPLSLSEIKAHLRISHDQEDDLLAATLKAAREFAEHASGQKLITQSWRQYEIALPANRQFNLRLSPVQSVSAVTVYDRDGNPAQLASTEYHLLPVREPAVLEIDPAVSTEAAANGVEIDLVVGMGDLGVDVNETLKRAILLLVAHWYEFRGAVPPSDQPVSLPAGFEALMAPYRRVRL